MPLSQRDATGADNPLASWNDGPTKKSILDFVARVTRRAVRILSLRKSALPPSIMTARCGRNIPFHFQLVLRSRSS